MNARKTMSPAQFQRVVRCAARAEKKALKALLRWWREDVKPRRPNEDDPASEGWAYDELWNAAKNLYHARRDLRRVRAPNPSAQRAGENQMNNTNTVIPAPLNQVVGQLRELLSKATPGPWAIANWGYTDEPHMVIEGPEIPKPATHNGFWFGGQKAVDWGDDWNADNASLIVATINAFPALLAIAEAAQAIIDAGDLDLQQPIEDRKAREQDLRMALSLVSNPERSGPTADTTSKPDVDGSADATCSTAAEIAK